MVALTGVLFESSATDRVRQVYRAICDLPANRSIFLGDAWIEIKGGDSGLTAVTMSGLDLVARKQAIRDAGMACEEAGGALRIGAGDATGVSVVLEEPAPAAVADCAARLDHVALRVRDLAAASARWEAITGIKAEQMGLHPISGGAFAAARVLLGDRMIELISPTPGVESAVAARLESHGEGPAALALPVVDVDAARERLEAIGARVLWQDPHWMVHPKDAGGVLVQLTPRVAH